jgi:hypothetical protein
MPKSVSQTNKNHNQIHIHIGDKGKKRRSRRHRHHHHHHHHVSSYHAAPPVQLPLFNRPQFLDTTTGDEREKARLNPLATLFGTQTPVNGKKDAFTEAVPPPISKQEFSTQTPAPIKKEYTDTGSDAMPYVKAESKDAETSAKPTVRQAGVMAGRKTRDNSTEADIRAESKDVGVGVRTKRPATQTAGTQADMEPHDHIPPPTQSHTFRPATPPVTATHHFEEQHAGYNTPPRKGRPLSAPARTGKYPRHQSPPNGGDIADIRKTLFK